MTNLPASENKVTVIIPLFNGARHLEDCLQSIASQTSHPDEIIVVDDGSTDDGPEIVLRHELRPTLVRQANAGPAAARNTGIQAARNQLLAFIDQDDVWHPEKLARQVRRFDQRPQLDLCYAKVDLFWDDPNCAEAQAFRTHPRARNVPGYIAPTLMARKAAFTTVGLLDENLRFGDGSAWAARALDMGLQVEMLDDVLLYHRMHTTNLTRNRADSSSEFLSIVRDRLRSKREAKTSCAI